VDVAVAAEVTVSTVYRWEQSKNAPHRDTMIKVAAALRTDPCTLFFADVCSEAA
jgi:transcriptional regulator with XRE-family HTH domain